MKAKVYKSTGSWYQVKTGAGELWNARLKGVFKVGDITSTNPLAVGDNVELEIENSDEHTGMIVEIEERSNFINRQSPSHKMQQHILAANLDQTVLIASLREPRTAQGFVDRFLVTAEAYHVPALLILNKADLYRKKELDQFEHWKEMYGSLQYPVKLLSIAKNEGLEDIKALLRGKVSLISGNSGVGKSSFINALLPELHLKTQHVSGWSGKGIHTTTFAEMFDMGDVTDGQLIDTPGIREFGLVSISKQELSHYFPEMRRLLLDCQFNNCLHINEPGCAIKKALSEGLIYSDRYESYCRILESIDEKNY